MKNRLFIDISDYLQKDLWQKGQFIIPLWGVGATILLVANCFVVKVFAYILLGGLASVILDFLSFKGYIGGWKAVLIFAIFISILFISQSHPYSPIYQGRLESMRRFSD